MKWFWIWYSIESILGKIQTLNQINLGIGQTNQLTGVGSRKNYTPTDASDQYEVWVTHPGGAVSHPAVSCTQTCRREEVDHPSHLPPPQLPPHLPPTTSIAVKHVLIKPRKTAAVHWRQSEGGLLSLVNKSAHPPLPFGTLVTGMTTSQPQPSYTFPVNTLWDLSLWLAIEMRPCWPEVAH